MTIRKFFTLAGIATAGAIALTVTSPAALAKLKTETVTYKVGETTLKGYLAYDDATSAKRPGVLVVHEWWGLNDYASKRADMLAKAGYVALRRRHVRRRQDDHSPTGRREFATAATKDPAAATRALRRGARQLIAKSAPTPRKIAAIGYCFGGRVVLGAALGGTELDGVVSFHGSLPQTPVPAGAVKAKVLVLHGAADGFTPGDQIVTFQRILADAKADWQFVSYGGAKHGFSNPDAASFGVEGVVYDAAADKRSWQAMLDFFGEIFR